MIAIIGMLMGLLVPAVQRTRELSRTTQCVATIRQTALGICAYESARRRFPAGLSQTLLGAEAVDRGNATAIRMRLAAGPASTASRHASTAC